MRNASGSMLKLGRLRWALMATSHTLTALKKGVLSPLTKLGYASPTSWPQGRNGLQGPDEQVGVEQQPHSGSMLGNRVAAVEHLFDLLPIQRLDVSGNNPLAGGEAVGGETETAGYRRLARGLWRVERHDLDERLAGAGDHEGLAVGGLLHELGEVRLGFVHVDAAHRGLPSLGRST